jgi:hypothetical protein
MRRGLVALSLVAVLLTGAAWAAARAKTTLVYVNGAPLREQVIVQDGVTYVPLRAVAEALGCAVVWDKKAGVLIWSSTPQLPTEPQVPTPGVNPYPRPNPPQPPSPGAPRTGMPVPAPTGPR